ncbi:acyltransferase family protein [Evansella clarkii]|uniref:acyltransferase family protein n=1 Tax=Evansella clarkii TaxID=79879 RepID=UPI000996FC48|nr:acyltransferase family protein [Evansella clarkii]
MKDLHLIKDIFWLRCYACLAVTLLHAIYHGQQIYEDPNMIHTVSYLIYMSTLFGVPVFVYITEFLLSKNYPNRVPQDFLKKRAKILLFPYLFMSIVYAFLNLESWTLQSFSIRILENVFLGKSPLYFILIIFQFYLLHMLFSKYLYRFSARRVLTVAFLVNFLYLSIFNFVGISDSSLANYIWNTGYWLPFIGWIFYFVLGFYSAKNYKYIEKVMRSNRLLLLIGLLLLTIISLGVMLLMNRLFLLDYNSKRVGMLLYAPSIIFLITFFSTRFNKVPKLVMIISDYSFSIFLLNWFYLTLLSYIKPPPVLNILSYSILMFIFTIFLCIGTGYIFNQISFGKYFVGQVRKYRKNITLRKDKSERAI